MSVETCPWDTKLVFLYFNLFYLFPFLLDFTFLFLKKKVTDVMLHHSLRGNVVDINELL